MYHNKESTEGDTTAQVWPALHDLSMVDYRALIGPSLLCVPQFHARHRASLKDLNLDTTSLNKAKCFPIGLKIQENTATSAKHSSYRELE
jgi:hypothetical protein